MNYCDLLHRLEDLTALCEPPGAERSGCFSSTDRASVYDALTDRYLCWDANDDGSGYVRRAGNGDIVALEMDGPGVIWRIWSALPQRGAMRVYLDGRAEPAIDVPFQDWFEREPGAVPPLNYSALTATLSRGRNSWIPIPFQQACRIELGQGWGQYYHMTYTRFPQGTRMPAYEERFTREGQIALAQLDRRLYDRGEETTGTECFAAEAVIAPGEEREVWRQDGQGILREIMVDPQRLSAQAAAGLLLRLYWDGSAVPAVDCPLYAFFGGAPGYARYRCLPMSMERRCFASRWPMPYVRGARLTLVNYGDVPETAGITVRWDVNRDKAKKLRFHAKWHQGEWLGLAHTDFAPGGQRWPDWPILLLDHVAGRFCGLHLHVDNRWREPEAPPQTWWYGQWDQKTADWWWGEGDEKFFVDGEHFPSTFGTGSEDYIGYAWAAEPPFARFDSPYACMNAMPLNGNGHTGVSRFQVADAVPFHNRFHAFLEKYHGDSWGQGNCCIYSAVPYWYQEADTDDGYPLLTRERLWAKREKPL